MKAIITLLFDLGNVLTKPQDPSYVEVMRSLMGGNVAMGDFVEAYAAHRSGYDRGDIDHRRYWAQVAERLGAAISDMTFARLLEADLKSWFNINEEMIDLVRELKGRVRHIGLVSNIHWDGVRYLERSFAWKDLFEVRVYSCEHRVNKPRPEIFGIALSKLAERPENCLFVDDLQENVEGARGAGLHAIRFTDLERLRTEMERGFTLLR